MKKRLLATLLCAVLIMSLLPITVLAAGGPKTYTFTSEDTAYQAGLTGIREHVYYKGDIIVFTPDVNEPFPAGAEGRCYTPTVGLSIVDRSNPGAVTGVTGGICEVLTNSRDGSKYMASFKITSDKPLVLSFSGAGPTGVESPAAPREYGTNFYSYRFHELQFTEYPNSYSIEYDLGSYGTWADGTSKPTVLNLDGVNRSYVLRIPSPVSKDPGYYFDGWEVGNGTHVLAVSDKRIYPVSGVSTFEVSLARMGGSYLSNPEGFDLTAVWTDTPPATPPVMPPAAETVATPTFSPAAGTFTSAQTVTLSCGTTGASIRYTTNGAAPTESSPVYSSAISVPSTTTIKAKAFKAGLSASTVASATYTITVLPQYDVPVTGSKNRLTASATVLDGTATISVNDDQLGTLLDNADTSGSITIDAGLGKNIDTAAIPASVVDWIADAANDSSKDVDGLTVALDSGTVSLDAAALAALSKQATDSTVTIHLKELKKSGLTTAQKAALTGEHAEALVVEVTMKSGDDAISSYGGGKITVTLPYKLKAGEMPAGIRVWHLASDGRLTLMECSYNERTKAVSFATDHLSQFIVSYDASAGWVNPFADVAKSDYFYDAVLWAVNEKITDGTGATTFSPAPSCTRAQMATFLWRTAGSPEPSATVNPFVDVEAGAYYYKAVLWAVEKGITLGTGEATFSPNDTCTRGQMATFLYRYANSPAVSGSNPFTDVAASDYYCNAVIWAAAEGITQGTSATTFSPKADCTRGQIVTFLFRYLGK